MDAILSDNKRNLLGYKDMYESQQRGVDHLYEHNFTQFVAPMGYGKTVVAMTAIGELIIDKQIDCALVIAPKRVAEIVWPGEQKLWKHLGIPARQTDHRHPAPACA